MTIGLPMAVAGTSRLTSKAARITKCLIDLGAPVAASMSEQTAKRKQEEQRQEQHVTAGYRKDHRGDQRSVHGKSHLVRSLGVRVQGREGYSRC